METSSRHFENLHRASGTRPRHFRNLQRTRGTSSRHFRKPATNGGTSSRHFSNHFRTWGTRFRRMMLLGSSLRLVPRSRSDGRASSGSPLAMTGGRAKPKNYLPFKAKAKPEPQRGGSHRTGWSAASPINFRTCRATVAKLSKSSARCREASIAAPRAASSVRNLSKRSSASASVKVG